MLWPRPLHEYKICVVNNFSLSSLCPLLLSQTWTTAIAYLLLLFFYCDNILFNRKAVLIGNFVEQDHGYTIYVLLAKMEIDLIDGPILITKYSHLWNESIFIRVIAKLHSVYFLRRVAWPLLQLYSIPDSH